MKKVMTLILTLSMLLCPLGVSAAESELQTAYGYAKLLNFGEFPEKPEYEAGIATASIPQYNSAAGATDSTSKSDLQEIHEYLRECFINCESQISLEAYQSLHDFSTTITTNSLGQNIANCPKLSKFFTETVNYYPELFHVSNSYVVSLKSSTSGSGYVTIAFYPTYVNPDNRSEIYSDQAAAKAAYDTALKTYNDEIEHIIGGIAPEMNDLEKALYVHDYLVTHFQYDLRLYSTDPSEKAKKVHDVYSFFDQKVGVCEAYAQAFNGIMHRLGIKCTSALNNKEEHTWNIITLNGKNYHIDVTHDDPVGQSEGAAKHSLFLLSDETVITKKDHSAWYSVMYVTSCTDNKYESGYAWNEADSSFEYVDGKWYFIEYLASSKSRLYSTKDFINFETVVQSFDTTFPVPDQPTYSYIGYFGGITAVGDSVYYSAPNRNIYCYNAKTDTVSDFTVSSPSSINTATSCRYEGNGILKVFFSSVPDSFDDGGYTEVTLFKIGDTDGDGKVSSTDIANTKKYLLGSKTDFNRATIDFGNKKQVNILDLVKIKKLAAKANN
ncbi:MAG: transglutaminase domain-containing protein [Acutalibacteraceae bacterium]